MIAVDFARWRPNWPARGRYGLPGATWNCPLLSSTLQTPWSSPKISRGRPVVGSTIGDDPVIVGAGACRMGSTFTPTPLLVKLA